MTGEGVRIGYKRSSQLNQLNKILKVKLNFVFLTSAEQNVQRNNIHGVEGNLSVYRQRPDTIVGWRLSPEVLLHEKPSRHLDQYSHTGSAYLGKPFSLNTACCCLTWNCMTQEGHHMSRLHSNAVPRQRDSGHLWSDESTFQLLLGKSELRKNIQVVIHQRCKSSCRGACAYVWRYKWCRSVYWNFGATYATMKALSFLWKLSGYFSRRKLHLVLHDFHSCRLVVLAWRACSPDLSQRTTDSGKNLVFLQKYCLKLI